MNPILYLRDLETGNPWAFTLLTMFVVLFFCALFTDKSDRRGL